jgi:pimeloyl-ACP methyl ester carboxylesterase
MSPAWEHRRIPLSWGRLSVYVAGDGPPLLLLHGLGGSGRYWSGLAPLLAGRRTLVAPDLAGFGRSDKPPVQYTREFHLAALDTLVEALGITDSLAVAGHSMGGILAALFAGRRSHSIESLALVAAPFPRRQMRPHGTPHGPVRVAVYRTMQRLLPLLSPLVRSQTFPRAVVADYLRHTLDSYQQTSNALIWDPGVAGELEANRLGSVHPTLLLYSQEDTTIAPDSLERWRALLPGAEVLQIPGAHQLLLRDHFATLARWCGH